MEIEEGKQIEYQGYIYVIYSLVRSNTDKPGTVLLSILENNAISTMRRFQIVETLDKDLINEDARLIINGAG